MDIKVETTTVTRNLYCPIQIVREGIEIPRKGTPNSAGYDLCAATEAIVPPGGRVCIPSGIKVAIPEGWYGRIAPRSGLAFKFGIDVLAGVIDSDYRGEIGIILQNNGTESVKFCKNDRIAQIIFEVCGNFEFNVVSDISETSRGENGFGSTGL